MRSTSVRADVQRLVRQAPFRPFILNLENGDRLTVEHPENIAFDPEAPEGSKAADRFHLITRGLVFFGSFEAVSSIVLEDTQEPVH